MAYVPPWDRKEQSNTAVKQSTGAYVAPWDRPKEPAPIIPQPKPKQTTPVTEPVKKQLGLMDYGIKALNVIGDIADSPRQLLANVSNNVGSILSGKGIQPYKKFSTTEVFPSSTSQKLDQFKQKNPVLGSIGENILYDATNPLSFVSGGIASDLAKAKNITKTAGQMLQPDLKIPKVNNAKSPNTASNLPGNTNIPTQAITTPTAPKLSERNAQTVKGMPEIIADNIDTRTQVKAPDINIKDAQSLGIIAGKLMPKSKEGEFGFWDKFYNSWIDRKHPINRVADETGNKNLTNLSTNIESAGGTTHYILNKGLADRTGKEIGESYGNIVKDIKPEDFIDLEDYLKHKHNINRAAEGKKIFADVDGVEITPEISTQKVLQYEQSKPQLKQVAERVNKFWDTFMREWAVNSGLVSDDLYNQLRAKYPNYIPTYRVFDELEKAPQMGAKKKFVNVANPVKKATGSERQVESPVEMFMSLIDRTVKASRYNEVGQSLLESIRKDPIKAKPWVEIVQDPGIKENLLKEINESLQNNGIEGMIVKLGEQFDEAFAKASKLKGRNIVRVMENGKPVLLKVNNKYLLDALTGMTKSEMGDFEKIARRITGIMKGLITVYNPIFGVRNLARDLPTGYVFGNENNPFKYTGQAAKGAADIIKDDPLYRQYKALGGGMGNIAADGATIKGLDINKGTVAKGLDKLNKFNNTIEDMQRFAQFKRTLQKNPSSYENLQQAITDSMEVTTNFSRSGKLAKSIDSSVLYFNAGVQGLDRLARQMYNKPLETLIKGGIGITAPTLFLDYINQNDPNYEKLDNRTKDTNFLFPKGDGTFIKLPKSRELGVLFGSLTERILRQLRGDNKAFKGFAGTVATNFSPANPVENNIAAPLVYNIPSNKDFADRPIVPQYMLDGRSPRYQYDDKTSEIAKKIGDVANISPKQVDYIIRSYTGIIGQIMVPANTKGEDRFKSIKQAFTADPLYSNQGITDFYDNFDILKQKASDKNILYNIPSDVVTQEEAAKNAFAKASKAISDLKKMQNKIRKSDLPNTEKERRIKDIQRKVVNISDVMNNKLE